MVKGGGASTRTRTASASARPGGRASCQPIGFESTTVRNMGRCGGVEADSAGVVAIGRRAGRSGVGVTPAAALWDPGPTGGSGSGSQFNCPSHISATEWS